MSVISINITCVMELTKLSKPELLIKCEELGITKYKSKNKGELIDLINGKTQPKKKVDLIIKEDVEDKKDELINIIMGIIEKDDRILLENKRITNMSRTDWGKTMAVFNQYIHRDILRHMLSPFGYSVYSTDDKDMPPEISIKISIANNSPGFDLVIVTPENEIIRVQSKLRQVEGIHDYSQQIHFETTRRNSKKNKDKNHTGHVCYGTDEFDFAMISLVNDKHNRDKIKDCDLWTYSLIPINELVDIKRQDCCYSHIKPAILKKNIIKITDDIRSKF